MLLSKFRLKPDGFDEKGRFLVDWPGNLGFAEGTVRSITRENPLPDNWDRVGGKSGINFTTLPEKGKPYSYDQRAIPYLENSEARHVGKFDNSIYFDVIDAVKDGDLKRINKFIVMKGKEPISEIEFDLLRKRYAENIQFMKKEINDVVDTTYGLSGIAAPWIHSVTGEMLMKGGAKQIVTPLRADDLEAIGIIPKY